MIDLFNKVNMIATAIIDGILFLSYSLSFAISAVWRISMLVVNSTLYRLDLSTHHK